MSRRYRRLDVSLGPNEDGDIAWELSVMDVHEFDGGSDEGIVTIIDGVADGWAEAFGQIHAAAMGCEQRGEIARTRGWPSPRKQGGS